MSVVPRTVSTSDADPLEREAPVARLEQLLARRDISLHELQAGVECASDVELMPYGLRAYRMNLLSLFGGSWSRDAILTTARRAAISKILGGWEHHHSYLPSLHAIADEPRLHDIPTEIVRDLLARGRGLIVMSFHLGHMRQIATDLAHAGISVAAPLAADAFSNYSTARLANPQAALWKHLRTINVEERGGSLALARTLAGGGCVFSTIDGNTGLDGPLGDQRRTTVGLLAAAAKVKTGLFDMAARFGSPILVVMAHTEQGRRVCRTAPVIDPEGPLAGDERKRFVDASTTAAYAIFSTVLTEHADEWCGGDLFHQWKIPCRTPPADLSAVDRNLTSQLADGDTLVVNHRRILSLDDSNYLLWSDAVSGKCFRLPQDMAAAAQRLCTLEDGIDARWMSQYSDAERFRKWRIICQLASRDAITVRVRDERSAPP